MDVRNTGGNKYETTAREIQNYQFSTFFDRSKMTSRKVTATALKVNVKKFQPTSTSSLACVLTNLDAFCPMGVHLPGEKSILPYFSSPRGVAISVPFPEVRNRKGTESGLEIVLSVHLQIFIFELHYCVTRAAVPAVLVAKELLLTQVP